MSELLYNFGIGKTFSTMTKNPEAIKNDKIYYIKSK